MCFQSADLRRRRAPASGPKVLSGPVMKWKSLSCDWAEQQFSVGGEEFMLSSNRNVMLLIKDVLSVFPPPPKDEIDLKTHTEVGELPWVSSEVGG